MNKKLTVWPESTELTPLDEGNQAVTLEWIMEMVNSAKIPESDYENVIIKADVEYIDYDSSAGVLGIYHDRPLSDAEKAKKLAEYNERLEMNRVDEIKQINNSDVFQKFLDRLPSHYQEEWRKVQNEA